MKPKNELTIFGVAVLATIAITELTVHITEHYLSGVALFLALISLGLTFFSIIRGNQKYPDDILGPRIHYRRDSLRLPEIGTENQ